MLDRQDVDVVSRSGLSGVLIVIVAALLWALFQADMPAGNRDAIMLVIGALLIRLSDVYTYYFSGGGAAGAKKDATISTLATTAQAAQAALPSADPGSIVLKEGDAAGVTATPGGTVIQSKPTETP
jgi:hypothetical protein